MNLIVGIDPGTTVGIAGVDFVGRKVFTHSAKDMGESDVISLIHSYGTPVVVASDVTPIPQAVASVARAFGAVTFFEELSVAEKKSLAPGLNDHERDALAAALNAFQKLEPKIRKARLAAREAEEDIVAGALKGQRITEMVRERAEVEEEQREEIRREQSEIEAKLNDRVVELSERMHGLKQAHDKLKKELAETRRKNKELNDKLQKRKYSVVDESKKVKELQHNIKARQRQLDEAKEEVNELRGLAERVAAGELQVVGNGEGYNVVKKWGRAFFVSGKKKSPPRELLDADEVSELVDEYKSRNP